MLDREGAGEEDCDGIVLADTDGGKDGFDCGGGTAAGFGFGATGVLDPPMLRDMVGGGSGASVWGGRSRGGLRGGDC